MFQSQVGRQNNGGGDPRVATVYEDEHGDLYMEEDGETGEVSQAMQNDEELVDGIHTLELAEQYEEDFSEADLIPSAFLGL